ncbi:MAG: hypothetical protein ACLQVY_14470 [Limisphaerales bacterium]
MFRDDLDYGLFLGTLGEACQKPGWRVHAYVLMSNPYHLLLETPQSPGRSAAKGMTWPFKPTRKQVLFEMNQGMREEALGMTSIPLFI